MQRRTGAILKFIEGSLPRVKRFRTIHAPILDDGGDDYSRDCCTLVIFKHYVATFVGRMREESDPAKVLVRKRNQIDTPAGIRDVCGLVTFGEAHSQVIHCATARTD